MKLHTIIKSIALIQMLFFSAELGQAQQSGASERTTRETFQGHSVVLSYKEANLISFGRVNERSGENWTGFAQILLVTEVALNIGDCQIRPGTYTVFPVENQGKARLVISSEQSLSAKYDISKDICRTNLSVEERPRNPNEAHPPAFEIRMFNDGQSYLDGSHHGAFRIDRGTLRYSASVRVPKT